MERYWMKMFNFYLLTGKGPWDIKGQYLIEDMEGLKAMVRMYNASQSAEHQINQDFQRFLHGPQKSSIRGLGLHH